MGSNRGRCWGQTCSIRKWCGTEYHTWAFIFHSCRGSFRKDSSMLVLQFIVKTWSWIRIRMGTGTLSEQHSLKTAKISETCPRSMDYSFLVLAFSQIDGRSASSLSLSKSRTPKLFYKMGQAATLLMNLTGQSYPIHHYSARGSYTHSEGFWQCLKPHREWGRYTHTT